MIERFELFTALITKINRNIRKIKNQEMAEYDLRGSHVSCLYYLYSEEGLTATELALRCGEDKSTISRSLDYLEKNGYLTCETKYAKRYKSPLCLTEKGKEAGGRIAEKINRILDDVGSCLTERERIEFYKHLTIISDRLDALGNPCDCKRETNIR